MALRAPPGQDRASVFGVVNDPDLALIEAYQAGDKRAAGTLIERHYRAIRRLLEGKLPLQEVDDAMQRVVVALLEARGKFRGESSFKTYAMRIAYVTAADYFRKRRRAPSVDVMDVPIPDAAAGPSTMLREKRSGRLLLEALRGLEPEDQFLLEPHYWEKMTGPELAEVYSCSESAIRHKLRRAKAHLEAQVRTIADEHRELADTLTDLDAWAQRLRTALRERHRSG